MSTEPDVSLEQRRHVDQVCDKFEERLIAGEQPKIEDSLVEATSHENRAMLLAELLCVEFAHLVESDNPLCLADYEARFPVIGLSSLTHTLTF